MEDTSNKIFNQLGIKDEELKKWESLLDYTKIKDTNVIKKGNPLFMRLNVDEEIEYIKEGMKTK